MVDRFIHRHRDEDVIEALGPLLTDERRARIEEVLSRRGSGLTGGLENLHDPHNGAAAIRSIEAFGLSELHVVEQAEPFRFSPTVTQGCEKWIDVRRYKDFVGCAEELSRRGFSLCAAVPGAERSLDEVDLAGPVALVFGNEHAGLTDAAINACDGSFGIPMSGFTQSLNLSVSVSVSTYVCASKKLRGLPVSEAQHLRARFYALSLDERAVESLIERHLCGQRSASR